MSMREVPDCEVVRLARPVPTYELRPEPLDERPTAREVFWYLLGQPLTWQLLGLLVVLTGVVAWAGGW